SAHAHLRERRLELRAILIDDPQGRPPTAVGHAVEIEGVPYWDGGFSGNPAVLPLILECHHPDIVIVMLHPASRPDTPVTGKAISEHMMELAFNSAFLREMGILSELKVLAEKGLFPFGRIERHLRRVRFHLIEPQILNKRKMSIRYALQLLCRIKNRSTLKFVILKLMHYQKWNGWDMQIC
ncbi:hypothetical protein L0152_17530, partial [bacterium]|nr:hypothetical protein [bacterium]